MADSSDNGSSSNGNAGEANGPGPGPDAPRESSASLVAAADNAGVPKPKRLACMICRKRKLKCDGGRPSCSTCSRLGHTCAYDEQRRKSGPKRGYVKALEERLKQVETLLKTQDPPLPPTSASPAKTIGVTLPSAAAAASTNISVANPPMPIAADRDMDARWQLQQQRFNSGESPQTAALDDFNFNANMGIPMSSVGGNFTWEMIGLGLEEPLPPQETIDELHQVYFEKVHPSIPMIHRFRYLAAMNLAPNQRPPVCLRYAMWTLACSISDKYADLKDLFYQRARKYVEADYVKGYGEHMISVAHCQTHILLACYEMKMMYFPRAWINTGSAVRLCQMIGLHRLDGTGLDVKQCLPPPKDWTEREERRRTFWMAFCEDRYASIGTGWPMTIDERDIMTKLPASEEAFDMSRPEQTQTLSESTNPSGAGKLSSFGGIVLLACLFGRNLVHLHRPDDDDLDHDLNGPFWKRHRQMDGILLNTSLCLPSHLKLPTGLSNPNVVFTNMSIHTSTICLHQAAIFKAEKNKLGTSVSSESKVRCITAANEIASIMRTISHMDLSAMNPFISFCLYVAARVFVQYLKSRPDDAQTTDSLRFLLSAMNALKRRNPLTESFLVQLDVDFEALATRIPKLRNAFPRPGDSPGLANTGNPAAKARTACDDPDGVQGILAYRNDCHFLKVPGNDGGAQDLAEAQGDSQGPSPSGFGQAWLPADQPSMPGLTPTSGPVHDRNGSTSGGPLSGFGDGGGDKAETRESPEAGQSSGPTPKSSGAGSDGRSHLAPGAAMGGGSGRESSSFRASPISPQQSMMGAGAGMDVGGGAAGFFGGLSGFTTTGGSMGGGEAAAAFGMASNGWPDMGGQASGMPPLGEGVLRALMNMGPMDAMDLSSWDSGNDTHMRG
ncbi:fungal specific transcription factor [Hirsutella rhossiliensis]|uniref:Fungal specific transcription factor domain-containing protein n=1 Tax=Hirsutella rhossiliensis TaxID=111463 RepID=A0A9P8SC95_9HYPO|nr:fungal specific transcription factor domain-containing protein [Hirsutella rhossiliensis]KAH0957316.1 fungal specific transcription factor domain-containing protein [Hirsutella rhossiliensis]